MQLLSILKSCKKYHWIQHNELRHKESAKNWLQSSETSDVLINQYHWIQKKNVTIRIFGQPKIVISSYLVYFNINFNISADLRKNRIALHTYKSNCIYRFLSGFKSIGKGKYNLISVWFDNISKKISLWVAHILF